MDFSLDYTPEQEEFRREVVEWLDQNAPKNVADPPDLADMPYDDWQRRREFHRKLGRKAWLAPGSPKEYGGGGLKWELSFVIQRELDRFNLNPTVYDIGLSLVAPALMVWGTEEQKRRYLTAIFTGEVLTWQVFTEPEAGSDVASVKTSARRDGDDYVINGHKIFVGGRYDIEQFWCLTCTDPNGPRHKNLSMFLVPATAEGVTITPLDLIGVQSSGCKNAVSFDNVHVPATALIGGLNNGWAVTNTTLEVEHGGLGEFRRKRPAEAFLRYCRSTPWLCERIAADPVQCDVLADIFIGAEIERLLVYRNFWMRSSQQKMSYESPQLALYKKENDIKAAASMQKILGPLVLAKDLELAPAEGLLEASQRFSIVTSNGGTPEVQKVIISRRLGIGRAEKEQAAKTR